MSPDSPLGKLAQRVSALEQRVEDLVARFNERLMDLAGEVRNMRKETAEDFRAFGPIVQEHHEIRVDLRHLKEDVGRLRSDVNQAVTEFRHGLDVLEERMEKDDKERRIRQEERTIADRRDRWARWLGVVALTLTFISMTVGWAILAL